MNWNAKTLLGIGAARLAAALFALWPALLVAQTPGNPDKIAGPGWVMGTADPVSPDAAAEYFQAKAASLTQAAAQRLSKSGEVGALVAPPPPFPSGSPATEQTTEIVELARGLMYDPKLIFDHVHNHIDYVPYFGSLKGATLTLLDGSGNDFDQASLLIALLRASGYSAQYQFGTMLFTKATLQNWGGSVDNWGLVFSNGGVPVTFSTDNLSATLSRVWVKATIAGTDYLLDPAFKTYTSLYKIDFASAMGYNRDQLLAAAGGTFTADYAQNLTESGLTAKLNEYAGNLAAYFRASWPNKSLEQIFGRRSVIETQLTSLPAPLPSSPTLQATWDEVPAQYGTTVRVVFGGIDVTYPTVYLAGKRFTLTYTPADFRPQLKLEGQIMATGNPTTQGTFASMTLTVDHPFAANSGTYADQTSNYSYKSSSTYAICSDFFGTGEQLVRKRQRELDRARSLGAANDSEPVLGETLNIMGLEWLKQRRLSLLLVAAFADAIPIEFHYFGRVCQESGYFIDFGTGFGTSTSKFLQGTNINESSRFYATGAISSSLEHAVLEQMMGAENPGVSTVRLLQIANSTGKKVFYATSANFAAIRPQLQGYSNTLLDAFQSKFASGSQDLVLLPENGQLQFGNWTGAGYVSRDHSSDSYYLGWIIQGNLNGGYSSSPGNVDPNKARANTLWNYQTDAAGWIGHLFSADPVEMASGSFTFHSTDISLGGGARPLGLALDRSYASSHTQDETGLGRGWRHNLDIRLKRISHGDLSLGARLPIDAAALLVSSWVTFDVLKNWTTAQGWMVGALASKWATDNLTQNAVAIYFGHRVQEFVRLPDGSYSPPPGVATQLVKNPNGTFQLIERFGTRIDFGTNDRASTITDADGNTMNFTYAPDGNLTQVTDAFGRSLNLTYANSRISSASDSTGRSVFYGYDGTGNLMNYTDSDGKLWTYSYDAEHRMTALANPLGVTTASMTYDGMGKVATQTTPRQGGSNATYNFFFSGFRNVEQDPIGGQTVYFYDEEGKSLGVQNALGHRTVRTYDAENHVIASRNPLNQSTTSGFDGNHNLIRVTNAQGKANTFTYDAQFRLTETTDPLGNKSQIGYDAEHHVTSTRNGESNQITTTHFPNGYRQSVTDARGTPVAFTYDAFGNPATSRVGTHPPVTFGYDTAGRMTLLRDQANAETRFEYNNRGLITKRIDALGRETLSTYDNAGRLASTTDRKGVTLTFTYTPGGKMASITGPGTSVSHTYDIRDNLVAMQDGLGTTNYSYDAASRLISMTDPHGFTTGYAYDANGNLTVLTYPGGRQVTYTYDSLNRLTSVRTWLPTQNTATYAYDAADRLVRLDQFNGTFTTYAYDKASRLVSLENRRSASDSICFYRYTLDGSGNRTRIVQNEPLVPQMTADSTTFTYNAQRNRLLAAGTNTFTYDNEGQLATNNATNYTFDSLHRLTAVSGSPALQFLYDGANHRLRATRGGVETRYIHDATGNVVAEADSSNNVTRYYIYGLGLIAAITPANQFYCYHFNGVGSTIAMTDPSKATVNSYAYSPFGRTLNREEGVPNRFTFVGQFGVCSEPTGIFHMRARYYDPLVGRFISEEPNGVRAAAPNLFAYGENRPTQMIDPSGLDSSSVMNEIEKWLAGAVLAESLRDAWIGMGSRAGPAPVFAAMGSLVDLSNSIEGKPYRIEKAPYDAAATYLLYASGSPVLERILNFSGGEIEA